MIYVIKNNMKFPFSRGILARSLARTGLSLYKIYEIVNKIDEKLENSGKEEVKSSEIEKLVSGELLSRGYRHVEKIYRVSKKFSRLGKAVIILIGGAPGVGKSAVSVELAHRLGITRVISTDIIREIIRYMVPQELIPLLHKSSFEAGDCLKETFVKDKLIYGFSQQVNLVTQGVLAYIERAKKECFTAIIDGVHLLPGFIELEVDKKSAFIFHYILHLRNEKEHINRFYLRAEDSLRVAGRYINEMRKIRKIQKYINSRAREEGVKIIDSYDLNETVDIITKDIFTSLESEII